MNIGRRRRTRLHAMPEISLTPLIDTALVLLVIFMVATPIMKNSLNIDLPRGKMKEGKQMSSESNVISVDAQERIRLNNESYTLEKLLQALSEKMKNTKEHTVYVHCDQKVSSGTLVKIIDSVKYVAGVEHVVLSTDRA